MLMSWLSSEVNKLFLCLCLCLCLCCTWGQGLRQTTILSAVYKLEVRASRMYERGRWRAWRKSGFVLAEGERRYLFFFLFVHSSWKAVYSSPLERSVLYVGDSVGFSRLLFLSSEAGLYKLVVFLVIDLRNVIPRKSNKRRSLITSNLTLRNCCGIRFVIQTLHRRNLGRQRYICVSRFCWVEYKVF